MKYIYIYTMLEKVVTDKSKRMVFVVWNVEHEWYFNNFSIVTGYLFFGSYQNCVWCRQNWFWFDTQNKMKKETKWTVYT